MIIYNTLRDGQLWHEKLGKISEFLAIFFLFVLIFKQKYLKIKALYFKIMNNRVCSFERSFYKNNFTGDLS